MEMLLTMENLHMKRNYIRRQAMKIYDISLEVFSCQVYPGDPAPEKKVLSLMEKGELYNLTAFSMCAHNGTHIDAPFHFFKDGKTVDAICLEAFVGMAYVAEHHGIVSDEDAIEIIEKAKVHSPEVAKRILIKGSAEVSLEAAEVFASSGIYFWEMNLRRLDRKLRQWQCIKCFWVLMLSCWKGFTWQRFQRVFIF